jgi:HAD superfamily hydrolase (TIGR01484 family)
VTSDPSADPPWAHRRDDAERLARARRPVLVATDLDGTLLRTDRTVSRGTRLVLDGLHARGITVLFVTARPPRWALEVAHLVGEHGLIIAGNGAFLLDAASGRVLEDHAIEPALVRELVVDLRREIPGIGFAAETVDGPLYEVVYPDIHPAWRPVDAPVVDLSRTEVPVGKLLARTLEIPADEVPRRVAEVVGERAAVSFSGPEGLAEISPAGVSKASALRDWCAQHDIPLDRVWAFGDMPNDLPMLLLAGTSFAVANAHPDVLAIADVVCPSNDDDGVAAVLSLL